MPSYDSTQVATATAARPTQNAARPATCSARGRPPDQVGPSPPDNSAATDVASPVSMLRGPFHRRRSPVAADRPRHAMTGGRVKRDDNADLPVAGGPSAT